VVPVGAKGSLRADLLGDGQDRKALPKRWLGES
jgi:hypothetical protein